MCVFEVSRDLQTGPACLFDQRSSMHPNEHDQQVALTALTPILAHLMLSHRGYPTFASAHIQTQMIEGRRPANQVDRRLLVPILLGLVLHRDPASLAASSSRGEVALNDRMRECTKEWVMCS